MIRLITAISIAASLAGCSTPMRLDKVPVEDRSSTTPAGASATSGSAQPGGQSAVTTVNTTQLNPDASALAAGRTVYFDYDSFVIRPEFQGLIETTATRMRTDKVQTLAIEGHTDERGGREYNLALGQRRADAVRRSLSLLGIPESRMESVSFGKEKPAMVGTTDAALEMNRRAEMVVR